MPKNKIIIALGLLIALLPALGFPHFWESVFEVIAGLSIVVLSVWITIDKKLSQRAKAQKRQARKFVPEEDAPVEGEEGSLPHPVRRVTDFYPKTGQRGRRTSDINWNTPDEPLG